MSDVQKHCNTCRYSYAGQEKSAYTECGHAPVQRCSNEEYNDSGYTIKKLLEDWGQRHCRFWAPKTPN